MLFLYGLQSLAVIGIITYADDSRSSKAFAAVCVSILRLSVCVSRCVSACLSVCPHDKTKTAKTTINKLFTEIVHHESPSPYSYNIKSKG